MSTSYPPPAPCPSGKLDSHHTTPDSWGLVHCGVFSVVHSFREKVKKTATPSSDKFLRREYALLTGILKNACHVVRVYGMERDACGMLYFLMPFSGRALIDMSVAVPDQECVFRQLLDGVRHMHDLCVAHRDLKPDNIVVDERLHVTIIDFGLATEFDANTLQKGTVGSVNYMAPEVAAGHWYHPRLIDLWSLGIIAFGIGFGCLPFTCADKSSNTYVKFSEHEGAGTPPSERLLSLLTASSKGHVSKENVPTWILLSLDRLLVARPDRRSLPASFRKRPRALVSSSGMK